MDLFSHQLYVESQRTKEDRQVAGSLMRCWKNLGIPDFLQMDNELSFRGSNKFPRSFGIVIRLCLYYGIQPVFIPISEPWRNDSIERFNETYSKKFFRRQWFSSYAKDKRIFWIHGALDWMFPVHTARAACEMLKMAEADITLHMVDDLSHTYPRDKNDLILNWFDSTLALPEQHLV